MRHLIACGLRFALLCGSCFLVPPSFAAGPTAPLQPFRLVMESPPTSLDPIQTVDAATLQLHLNTYSLLFRQRAEGHLEPSLAKSARSSQDGRHWDIQIRRGVYFCGTANGREVTAKDVAATLLRAARHPRSRVSWLFARCVQDAGIPRIKAVGRDMLSLDFIEPIDLPRYLSLPQLGILPKEAAERADFNFNGRSHGSGPYRIVALQPDRVDLESCQNGLPKAETPHVSLQVVRDPEVALGALTSGRFDAMALSFSQWRKMKLPGAVPKGFRLQEVKTVAEFDFLVMNTQSPKLRDKNIRQALNFALDRAALCSGPLLGYCVASDFTSSMTGKGTSNALFRPDAARAAWASASNKPDSLTLLSLPDARNVTAATWVAEQWRTTFGIRTEIRTLEFGPMLGTLMGGNDFDVATLWVQPLADIPEIWYLAWQPGDLPPKGRNISRLDNAGFASVFRSLQEPGKQKQPAVLDEIDHLLQEDPPAIPLGQRLDAWLLSDRFDWQMGPVMANELWMIRSRRQQ